MREETQKLTDRDEESVAEGHRAREKPKKINKYIHTYTYTYTYTYIYMLWS